MLTIEMLRIAEEEGIESRRVKEQREYNDRITYALDKFNIIIEEILNHARNGNKMANGEYKFNKTVYSFIDTKHMYASGQYDKNYNFNEKVLLKYAKQIYTYIQDNQLISKEITFILNKETLVFEFYWK